MTDINEAPLLALIGTVDRTLVSHGVDPKTVTEEDKILIATQYVETGCAHEKMCPQEANNSVCMFRPSP